MTPQQLAAADCKTLTSEEKRVQENIAHLNEASGINTGGSALLAVLDAVASSKGAMNTGGAGSSQMSQESTNNKAEARRLEQRANIISQLRARRGCA
jgi:hypothetical protein